MSYILEALRKSQQLRELGQVPTLEHAATIVDDREPSAPGHWGLLAVGLAAVAVVIALYAALRPPGGPPVVAVPLTPPPELASPPALTGSPEVPGTSAGGVGPVASAVPAAGAFEPLVAPPPPRSSGFADGGPVAPRGRLDVDDLSLESDLDPELEYELWRQIQAEEALAEAPPPRSPPRPPVRPAAVPPVSPDAKIPPDLVEDIEAFKQQVRREQALPPPPAQRPPARITGDPTKLRLTAQEQAILPAYLMTAHVYDKEPGARFVVVNGLKYQEGEETLEGLRVERILPEGAVLSYIGKPFFVRR